MPITLEKIDELRKRANVSYTDAKDALEKCSGDILEAMILLERDNKVKKECHHEYKGKFVQKLKNLFHKGNNTYFVMRKNGAVVFNFNLTITIIITIIGFHLVLPAMLIALVAGYRFSIEGSENENIVRVNETFDKVSDAVDNTKKQFTEETPSSDNERQQE